MAAMANADYPRLAGLQLTTVTEAYKLITAKKKYIYPYFRLITQINKGNNNGDRKEKRWGVCFELSFA